MGGEKRVPVTRVSMETGRTRQLIRHRTQAEMIQAAWELTDDELGDFDFFFRVGLVGGTQYFDMPVPGRGDTLSTVLARFVGGTYRKKYKHFGMWDVTATLETESLPLITDMDSLIFTALAIWGDLQGCLDFSELFHRVVHETIPTNIQLPNPNP